MKTWMVEGAVVAAILVSTTALLDGGAREWLGALAVQLTFHYVAIGDRMQERQAQRTDVECYRWSRRLLVGKESCWLVYFALAQTWAALVGVGIFLMYPLWRRYWRGIHPLRAPLVGIPR